MNEISIRVVGIPAAQGSKTLTRYGAMIESSKKVKPWRTDVKEASLNCYTSGALNMPVKVDIDKLCRSTLDGLSVSAGGSVLEDDCLAVELCARKRYVKKDELPGAYIAISSVNL